MYSQYLPTVAGSIAGEKAGLAAGERAGLAAGEANAGFHTGCSPSLSARLTGAGVAAAAPTVGCGTGGGVCCGVGGGFY